MGVAGLQAWGVADPQPAPVAAVPARLFHHTVAGGQDRGALRGAEIHPLMHPGEAEDGMQARAERGGDPGPCHRRAQQQGAAGAGLAVQIVGRPLAAWREAIEAAGTDAADHLGVKKGPVRQGGAARRLVSLEDQGETIAALHIAAQIEAATEQIDDLGGERQVNPGVHHGQVERTVYPPVDPAGRGDNRRRLVAHLEGAALGPPLRHPPLIGSLEGEADQPGAPPAGRGGNGQGHAGVRVDDVEVFAEGGGGAPRLAPIDAAPGQGRRETLAGPHRHRDPVHRGGWARRFGGGGRRGAPNVRRPPPVAGQGQGQKKGGRGQGRLERNTAAHGASPLLPASSRIRQPLGGGYTRRSLPAMA